MKQATWDEMCKSVLEQMIAYVTPFNTPISTVLNDEEGEHHGSASFVNVDGAVYLVTNEHVARKLYTSSLAHQFHGSDIVARLINPFCVKKYPIDFAASRIHSNSWTAVTHRAKGIPESKFAIKHAPVSAELLFCVGYSGERSRFLYGTLIEPGTPYLMQEIDFPSNIDVGDKSYHFAIPYLPDKAWAIDEDRRGLPKPPGMSGSILWNTRFIEITNAGQVWSPDKAMVTGIIWGWPSSRGCLLATRVEHLELREITDRASKCASIQ